MFGGCLDQGLLPVAGFANRPMLVEGVPCHPLLPDVVGTAVASWYSRNRARVRLGFSLARSLFCITLRSPEWGIFVAIPRLGDEAAGLSGGW